MTTISGAISKFVIMEYPLLEEVLLFLFLHKREQSYGTQAAVSADKHKSHRDEAGLDVTLWLRKFLCSCTTFPTVTAALNGRMSCFEFPLRGSVRGQVPWQSSPAIRRILSATKQEMRQWNHPTAGLDSSIILSFSDSPGCPCHQDCIGTSDVGFWQAFLLGEKRP
ncbi:hypothetical protein PAMP_013842 [Pampus punctatissimus]